MYTTVSELRAEYANSDNDEFSGRTDSELESAIARASSTIDRYRPAGSLSDGALVVLKSVCFPLSRAYAHDEIPVEENHPLEKDRKEALNWLNKLAAGKVSLPTEDNSSSAAPVVIAPPSVFV